MKNIDTNGNKNPFNNEILKNLLDDPTLSLRLIAKKLGSYRQKVWRMKKKLEDEKVIWGYTAIVDESKLGHVINLVLMKMKPMTNDLVDLMTRRIKGRVQERQSVRLIDVIYVNGEYDFIVVFSAPSHAASRRYYDSLRLEYDSYLLEKPVMMDVNLYPIREGKVNPDINDLYDFCPR